MPPQFPLHAPVQRQRGAGLASRRNVVSQPSPAPYALTLTLILSTTTSQAIDASAFDVLLQQSLTRALVLLKQQANAEAARLDAAQSRRWFNPKVDALSEDLNVPSNDGQSPRRITFSISQSLELGGGRASRIAMSDRDPDMAEARRREVEVLWITKLAVAYGTVEAAQGRQCVTADELNHAGGDLRTARAQAEAGKEASVRVAQIEAGAAAARDAERAAIADLVQTLEELSAFAGPQECFTGITGPLFSTVADAGATADEPPTLRVT